MPVLTPAELWQQTGRDDDPRDLPAQGPRRPRRSCSPMTHEETVTFHAREISSYRQLPQILYHFSIKERDEPRPRGGLLRVREFIMKDAYSFDRDEAGLDVSFRKHDGRLPPDLRALRARVLRRAGGVGDDGRQASRSTTSRRPARARTRSSPARTATTRPISRSRAAFRGARRSPSALDAPEGGRDARRRRRSTRSPRFLGIDAAATSKAMPVVTKHDGTLVLALVRGDDRLEEAKLAAALGSDVPARDRGGDPRGVRRRPAARSARSASTGEIVADEALREGQFVAGANRDGWHLLGVEAGRDYEPRFADIREPREGDALPDLRRRARASRRRSRSGTSSSSARATRSRSARRSWTRTATEKPDA